MIRQAAFENAGKMLKGGLHCHTTRSDGKVSPEDTVRLHVKNGYDFLAITDHRFYNFENFAPDTDIIIVPGMEFDDLLPYSKGFRCFHTVCIGPAEGNGFTQDQRFERGTAIDQYSYQRYLDWLHANNNMTIYCHPQWSSTPARYFDNLKGDFAMEIWNSGCAIENEMDTDAACWDELLGMGKRIWGVATDDGHAEYHHCKGWVMVNSERNLNAILSALKDGKFYSSTGPVIKDFYVENDIAVVETEPCTAIRFHSDRHPTPIFRPKDGQTTLTHAEFNLRGSYDYVRVSVRDEQGHLAWTNPIFLD